MIVTNNEIIEALECCTNEKCDKCPMHKKCWFFYDRKYVGAPEILTLSLDLIKRQKEKIDKLERDKRL